MPSNNLDSFFAETDVLEPPASSNNLDSFFAETDVLEPPASSNNLDSFFAETDVENEGKGVIFNALSGLNDSIFSSISGIPRLIDSATSVITDNITGDVVFDFETLDFEYLSPNELSEKRKTEGVTSPFKSFADLVDENLVLSTEATNTSERLAQGGGAFAGFLIGGGAGTIVKGEKGAKAVAGLLGIGNGSTSGYNDYISSVKKNGLEIDPQTEQAAVLFNSLIGASEAFAPLQSLKRLTGDGQVPVGKLLERIDEFTGNAFSDALQKGLSNRVSNSIIQGTKGALEEGGQEFIANVMSNAVAKGLKYDPDRGFVVDETIQGSKDGALIGAVFNSIIGAMSPKQRASLNNSLNLAGTEDGQPTQNSNTEQPDNVNQPGEAQADEGLNPESISGQTGEADGVRPTPSAGERSAQGDGNATNGLGNDPRTQLENGRTETITGDGNPEANTTSEEGAASQRAEVEGEETQAPSGQEGGEGAEEATTEELASQPTALQSLKTSVKKNFTSTGGAPKSVAQAVFDLRNDRAAESYRNDFVITSLVDETKKLPKQDADKANSAIKDFLTGKVGEEALPNEGIRQSSVLVRDQIDSNSDAIAERLQQKLDAISSDQDKILVAQLEATQDIDAKEAIIGQLPDNVANMARTIDIIKESKGEYLNNSYKIFSDKTWKDKVKKTEEYTDAIEYVRQFDSTGNERKALLPPLEAQGIVNATLEKATATEDLLTFINGERAEKQRSGILKRRKDIPEPIRRLLGQYEDPFALASKTLTKQADWINRSLYNERISSALSDNGLLKDKAEGNFAIQIPNEVGFGELQGKWVNQDTKDILDQMDEVPQWISGPVGRFAQDLSSFTKANKTVFAPTTVARNFLSGAMLAMRTGHSPLATSPGEFGRWETLVSNSARSKEYKDKLFRLGVLDGARSSEIRDMLNASEKNPGIVSRIFLGKTPDSPADFNRRKWLINKASKIYAFGDDFWRVLIFEREAQNIMNDTGVSRAEAEIEAANILSNVYPTYSRIPRQLRALRNFPLVGTFVSFPYEMARTNFNLLEQIQKDAQSGRQKRAIQRSLGLTASWTTASVVAELTAQQFFDDEEAQEDVRALAAPWQRNAALAFTSAGGGVPTFTDLSSLFPDETMARVARAIIANPDSDGWKDNFYQAAKEFVSPYLSEDISVKAIRETLENRTEFGPIYNERDTLAEKTGKAVFHLFKGVGPGVLTGNAKEFWRANEPIIKDIASQNPTWERIVNAVYETTGGKISRGGKEYTNRDAFLALAGIRNSEFNVPAALTYKGSQYKNELSSVSAVFNRRLSDPSIVNDSLLKDIAKDYAESRYNIYEDVIKDIGRAERLGTDKDDIENSLNYNNLGLSKKDVADLVKGEIPPLKTVSSKFNKDRRQRFNTREKDRGKQRAYARELDRRRKIINRELDLLAP